MGNSDLLIVHRNMEPVHPESVVDIVLTPQFYTLKREQVPVRYTYQAKRIAPSLFEGLLEEESGIAYDVYREGEHWVFIAYNPEEISAFLQSKGVLPSQTGRVVFAQQLVSSVEGAVQVGEKEALVAIDGNVAMVPRSSLGEVQVAGLERSMLPSKGIRLAETGDTLFSNRQAYWLSAIFILFGILWIVEGVRYGKNNQVLQAELERYYAKYPALQSSYKRDSILQKYRTIDQNEREKREITGKIAGVITKGVTLDHLSIDKNRYRADFSAENGVAANRLKRALMRAGLHIEQASGNHIAVGGVL